MKERPILFSGEMVRAILTGRKTMTRRVMTRMKVDVPRAVFSDVPFSMIGSIRPGRVKAKMNPRGAVSGETDIDCWLGLKPGEFYWVCPYCDGYTQLVPSKDPKRGAIWQIQPDGDRLWVRETWRPCYDDGSGTAYRADRLPGTPEDAGPWNSSRFMPRKRSRITLGVETVSVERLQDITPEDCVREGSYWATDPDDEGGFANLWDSLNGKREGCAWADNPWAWVIQFRRLAPTRDSASRRGGEKI